MALAAAAACQLSGSALAASAASPGWLSLAPRLIVDVQCKCPPDDYVCAAACGGSTPERGTEGIGASTEPKTTGGIGSGIGAGGLGLNQIQRTFKFDDLNSAERRKELDSKAMRNFGGPIK
ncbi:hypothetical protein IHQ68_15185 [Chelatococcus sambhunathii]|uniref:Uncharacterized protein n=2 Tax=Chelatococcus sambhunathii TaxID=363953 RepID=A0ABU1DIK7_9HYPH|nr:hypothetical protein [Chelatococcus sambhunathii]